jgi:hypothetical protein
MIRGVWGVCGSGALLSVGVKSPFVVDEPPRRAFFDCNASE